MSIYKNMKGSLSGEVVELQVFNFHNRCCLARLPPRLAQLTVEIIEFRPYITVFNSSISVRFCILRAAVTWALSTKRTLRELFQYLVNDRPSYRENDKFLVVFLLPAACPRKKVVSLNWKLFQCGSCSLN